MNAIIIGILLPLLGTMLGSAFVFFMKKEIPDKMQKTLLGFASGVMVAASVWSLLIPSIEMVAPLEGELSAGLRGVLPAAIGFLAGIAFLLLIDELDTAPAQRRLIGFAIGFVLMMVMDVVLG
jgi:ZIP family zinc transporter